MKKIKEVIEITGLSRRTLQYYDDCGLVKANRTAEKYRLYSEAELQKLWELLIYREMGFRLEEISELLDGSNEYVQCKLKDRLSHIDHKIQELERMEQLTDKVLQHGMPDMIPAELTSELGSDKELAKRFAERN